MRQEEDQAINNFQAYQEQQLFLHQQQEMQQQQNNSDQYHNFFGGDRGFINMFSAPHPHPHPHEVSPIPYWSMPQVPPPFMNIPPQPSVPNYTSNSLFNNRMIPSPQFQHAAVAAGSGGGGGGVPFGLQAEIAKMSAQEIMEAKALAASKSHSEAERRRRERINNHLARLRTLLPSTTKTDKASLLGEVIEHVKELKRQTCLIEETSPVPTEADELTVDAADEDGKFVIKASLCCEDRSDLLPELIKTLKALRLRTLKADITTLGGRVKNVLFITAQDQDYKYYSSCCSSSEENININNGHYYHHQEQQYSINSIQEALKAVMDKSNVVGDDSGSAASGNVKRQRTNIV